MFLKKVVIKIDGMSCEHCAKRVEEGLNKIDTVKSVKVNLKDKNATIKYSDSLDFDKLKEVVEELGYHYLGE